MWEWDKQWKSRRAVWKNVPLEVSRGIFSSSETPKSFPLFVRLLGSKQKKMQLAACIWKIPRDSLSIQDSDFPKGIAWRNCLAVNPESVQLNPRLRFLKHWRAWELFFKKHLVCDDFEWSGFFLGSFNGD